MSFGGVVHAEGVEEGAGGRGAELEDGSSEGLTRWVWCEEEV